MTAIALSKAERIAFLNLNQEEDDRAFSNQINRTFKN
jgi:hypothetical protein